MVLRKNYEEKCHWSVQQLFERAQISLAKQPEDLCLLTDLQLESKYAFQLHYFNQNDKTQSIIYL